MFASTKFCAVTILIGMTQLANAQTNEAELLDSQRKMLGVMEQMTAGQVFSSSGLFGMLADLKAERDQAVKGQVEKLDTAVREVLVLIDADKRKANILALSIMWVPVGDKDLDTLMIAHYDGIRESLLASISG